MRIEIGLVENPSTGYGWQSSVEPSSTRYAHEDLPEGGIPRIGGEVTRFFVFDDLEPGTEVVFEYRRPWSNEESIQYMRINV